MQDWVNCIDLNKYNCDDRHTQSITLSDLTTPDKLYRSNSRVTHYAG